MSDKISPAVEAAIPAYVAMLNVAADEEAPFEELEHRCAVLAQKHGLTEADSASAFAVAAMRYAERLGPRGIAVLQSAIGDAMRKTRGTGENA